MSIDRGHGIATSSVLADSYDLDALISDTEAAKVAAQAAQAASELALDTFDDRYLGAKAADPTVDNDGNALIDGAMYFDTALNITKIYDLATTAWKRTTPTTADQTNIDTVSAKATEIGRLGTVDAVADMAILGTVDALADIATLADIEDGTDATDAIQTVAGISANVTTTAGISANVTTVANNDARITILGDDIDRGFSSGYTDAALLAVSNEMLAIIVATAPVDQVLYDLIISTVDGYQRGDIDNDGDIDINDTQDVLRFIAGLEDYEWIRNNILGPMLADMPTYGSYFDSAILTISNDLDKINIVATDITNVNNVALNKTNVDTVAGINASITTVAGNAANVNTVAGISSNVTTVAGISSDVASVAADSTDIGTVAAKATEIGRLGTADAVTDLNTLGTADVVSDMNTLGTAGNVTNMNTLAGISTDITTAVGISADITAAATNAADITAVATEVAKVVAVANDLAEATSEIDVVAASIANVDLVGGSITNVNEVANNIGSVNAFGEQYRVSATEPTTSLDAGDLWFDTTAGTMKVYDGSNFVNAGSSVNGIENSVEHIATAGQTSFAATYDAGYLNVFLNGVKLDSTDYTATNGSTVVLDTGATVGDSVFVQSFGTFVLADMYTKTASDARFLGLAGGTMIGDVSLGDNVRAKFGASDDLQIWHDGGNSRISDVGTGNLIIRASSGTYIQGVNGENGVVVLEDGAVSLWNNGSQKLATTSTGIDVTGTITCDGLEVTDGGFETLKIESTNNDAVLELRAGGDINTNWTMRNDESESNTLDFRYDNSSRFYITKDGYARLSGTGAKFEIANSNVDISMDNSASGQLKIDGDGYAGAIALDADAMNIYTNAETRDVVLGVNETEILRATSTGIDVTGTVNGLEINTTATSNLGLGTGAVDSITTGDYNVGVGDSALTAVTEGVRNTAIGTWALKANTTGSYNTASGYQALYANTTGTNNTATGYYSLKANTTGSYNTATGYYSLKANTTGTNNVASGYQALLSSTTGTLNTALGYKAGDNITTGSSNIIIGASVDAPSATASNQLNIGNTIYGDTSTGNVHLGASTTQSQKLYVTGAIYATGDITAFSDERIKDNIQEIPNALDAVDKIRGVSYTRTDTKKDSVGVIAQEVEALFPELIAENAEGIKSVNYNGLVGVLLSAVKELSAKVKELEDK